MSNRFKKAHIGCAFLFNHYSSVLNIRFYRVIGDSMLPTLKNNDYVLGYSFLWMNFKINDLVVVNHPEYGVIVKRIVDMDIKTKEKKYALSGDNQSKSTSSEKMGWIMPEQIIAKVLWAFTAK